MLGIEARSTVSGFFLNYVLIGRHVRRLICKLAFELNCACDDCAERLGNSFSDGKMSPIGLNPRGLREPLRFAIPE